MRNDPCLLDRSGGILRIGGLGVFGNKDNSGDFVMAGESDQHEGLIDHGGTGSAGRIDRGSSFAEAPVDKFVRMARIGMCCRGSANRGAELALP
jgi:hypothetical protein